MLSWSNADAEYNVQEKCRKIKRRAETDILPGTKSCCQAIGERQLNGEWNAVQIRESSVVENNHDC